MENKKPVLSTLPPELQEVANKIINRYQEILKRKGFPSSISPDGTEIHIFNPKNPKKILCTKKIAELLRTVLTGRLS